MSIDMESSEDQIIADNVVMEPTSMLNTPILAPPVNISGDTFVSRVFLAIGRRYIVNMRRSVQTVVLYEANRCLSNHYGHLKPFQRKAALLDTAKDLVNSLSFIPVYQRMEIMFRTAAGKVVLSPELAWRRMKLIHRDISKTIIPKINILIKGCKDHDELCTKFLQHTYAHHSGKTDRPYSEVWEYTHIHYFLAFKMYYVGRTINIDMPPACDPNPERVVPADNPLEIEYGNPNPPGRKRKLQDSLPLTPVDYIHLNHNSTVDYPEVLVAGVKERRALLKEVKDHMDLLKEFEGLVPNGELKRQRKDLFMSLPPIPIGRFD